MSIWQQRTPEDINAWLCKNEITHGLRISEVERGTYLVYHRCLEGKNAVLYLGNLGDCREAIAGYIYHCGQQIA